jgi:hypothetical protein
MKKIITGIFILLAVQYSIAQNGNDTTIKVGKTPLKIQGQGINSYQTRDIKTNEVFTVHQYFNITGTWIYFYTVVAEGKTALQVYEYKIPSDTKLSARVEEVESQQYMQATMYKVVIKCPAGDLCAVQTVTTKDEKEKSVVTESLVELYFENKEFAEKFAKAF